MNNKAMLPQAQTYISKMFTKSQGYKKLSKF